MDKYYEALLKVHPDIRAVSSVDYDNTIHYITIPKDADYDQMFSTIPGGYAVDKDTLMVSEWNAPNPLTNRDEFARMQKGVTTSMEG